jgi:hypothetical protein
MQKIYEQAGHVVIWLGPEADESDLAMSTLSGMFEYYRRWVDDGASKSLIEYLREPSEIKDELLAILKSLDGHFDLRKCKPWTNFSSGHGGGVFGLCRNAPFLLRSRFSVGEWMDWNFLCAGIVTFHQLHTAVLRKLGKKVLMRPGSSFFHIAKPSSITKYVPTI